MRLSVFPRGAADLCEDLGNGVAVSELVLDTVSERIIPCAIGTLCVPSRPHEKIEWGPRRAGIGGAGDLRMLIDNKVPFLCSRDSIAYTE